MWRIHHSVYKKTNTASIHITKGKKVGVYYVYIYIYIYTSVLYVYYAYWNLLNRSPINE